MSANENLTITQCPECGKAHTYRLEVRRASSIGAQGLLSSQSNTFTGKEYFTRLFTCPVTNNDFQARFYLTVEGNERIEAIQVKRSWVGGSIMSKANHTTQNSTLRVVETGSISPHSKAVYEAGKTLLIDSISTGREFCHSMIGYSTGAIPIYLGLLAFILPEKYTLGIETGIAVTLPAILFLLASVTFVVGYLPIKTKFSLDLIEEIERERERIIHHRSLLIKIGFSVFAAGMLSSILIIVMNIGMR
ncbi:MAG: hypothetical protein QM730_17450 [Anaerolineales bacterium]